jgi:uncharacterized membrane protein affecting hemolysin expression
MPKIKMHHCNAPEYRNRVAIPSGERDLKQNYCLVSGKSMADSSRKKFIIIAFAAGMSLGLMFTSLSFINSQRNRTKDAVLYFASGQAKLISSNIKCALSFEDAKDANVILESLKTQYNIAFAGIYDCNGKLFATYYRGDINPRDIKPLPPSKAKCTSHDGFMVISEPVIHQKQFLGTVCLWAQS